MVLLAVILLVLAVVGGIASHVLAHAARHVAEMEPRASLSFSALIGWAAFCQAVFFCFLVSGALFLTAHALGWH